MVSHYSVQPHLRGRMFSNVDAAAWFATAPGARRIIHRRTLLDGPLAQIDLAAAVDEQAGDLLLVLFAFRACRAELATSVATLPQQRSGPPELGIELFDAATERSFGEPERGGRSLYGRADQLGLGWQEGTILVRHPVPSGVREAELAFCWPAIGLPERRTSLWLAN